MSDEILDLPDLPDLPDFTKNSNIVNNSSTEIGEKYNKISNRLVNNNLNIDNSNLIKHLDNALNMASDENSIKVFLEVLNCFMSIDKNLFKLYRDKAFNKLNSVKNSDTHTNK